MNAKYYKNYVEERWTEVSRHVKDCLVFLDDFSAECLHWHGGLNKFLEGGAISVENFTPFVKADLNIKKVVFIITSPIIHETMRTLMVIVRANSFRNCIIFTPLPAKFHAEELLETEQNFINLENRILSWMGNMNYSATVYHFPLSMSFVSQNLFIMPSFSKHFSVFKCGFLEMNRKRATDNTLKDLPAEMQASIKQFAYSLNSFLDSFQVKPDFFSLGFLSRIVGCELENLTPYQKKKSYSRKVSVVIVDRLLDLAGPLSQSYETMFDHILMKSSHLPGHVFDVSIMMDDLVACKSDSVFGRPLIAPGCLAHKNNPAEISALNAILSKRPREVLIEMNRIIAECAAKEGVKLDLTMQLNAEILRNRILSFRDRPKLKLKYCGLLQQALAVVQALSSSHSTDQLSATEKALMQYLTTSGEEVINNVIQMISEKDEMKCKMEEIMIFIAFIYMLSGYSYIANEGAMQATLVEAFFQADDMTELASLFVDGELEDDSVLEALRTFLDVLKRLSTVRKSLKKYSSVFKSDNPAFPASYNPLLKQLLQDFFDHDITDIPDVEFHSAGLTNYIKTGFSLFMNVAKPQPRDNPVIFIILLGGITPSEIKFIKELSAQHKETEVIVGCTEVLSPKEVLKDLGLIVKELSLESSGND